MDEVITMVTSMGFPAALCLIILKYMIDQRDAHKAESDAYRTAIDANTNAITALTEWLRARGDKNV